MFILTYIFLSGCNVEPMSGTYTSTMSNPSDTCNAETSILEEVSESQEIEITVNETSINFDDIYTLARDGSTASLEEVFDEQTEPGMYTLTQMLVIEFEWITADTAEGSMGFDFSCTGEACDDVTAETGVTLPCEARYSVLLEMVE